MGRIHLEATVFADPDDERDRVVRRSRVAVGPTLVIGGLCAVLLAAAGIVQRTVQSATAFTPVAEHAARAEAEGRTLLLYFTGDECAACRRMEEEYLLHPQWSREIARRHVVATIHRSAPEFEELARRLDVSTLPTFIVTTSAMVPVTTPEGRPVRQSGHLDPSRMREFVGANIAPRTYRASGGETFRRREGN